MDDTNRGGRSSGYTKEALDELDDLWEALEERLTAYLSTMVDPDESDHLLIELPGGHDEGEAGCAPYAQFAAFGAGTMIRAEISGDAYLSPRYSLGADGYECLIESGWRGNDEHEKNWFFECPVTQADAIANHVLWVLRSYFGVAHPQQLTYEAFGPAATGAAVLGLDATEDVPPDEPQPPGTPIIRRGQEPVLDRLVLKPLDRDGLLHIVESLLREKYDRSPSIDNDGDFVLRHMDQSVRVRVRTDMVAVEIMARVAHGVYSRRATAVEIGLLNRDHPWVRWTLRDRDVWQTLVIPALPFAPGHLDAMLDLFLVAMVSTRDDLAHRIGARVA